jgi:hypothetical protein
MKRSKLIFLLVALAFVLVMIGITVHMASQTTPPWEKKKEILEKYKVK